MKKQELIEKINNGQWLSVNSRYGYNQCLQLDFKEFKNENKLHIHYELQKGEKGAVIRLDCDIEKYKQFRSKNKKDYFEEIRKTYPNLKEKLIYIREQLQKKYKQVDTKNGFIKLRKRSCFNYNWLIKHVLSDSIENSIDEIYNFIELTKNEFVQIYEDILKKIN